MKSDITNVKLLTMQMKVNMLEFAFLTINNGKLPCSFPNVTERREKKRTKQILNGKKTTIQN